MAFEFVEEYYDPMTFAEGVIESYDNGVRIQVNDKEIILSKDEAVKLAIKIYSYCFQEDWSYLE